MKIVLSAGDLIEIEFDGAEEVFEVMAKKGGRVHVTHTSGFLINEDDEVPMASRILYETPEE